MFIVKFLALSIASASLLGSTSFTPVNASSVDQFDSTTPQQMCNPLIRRC